MTRNVRAFGLIALATTVPLLAACSSGAKPGLVTAAGQPAARHQMAGNLSLAPTGTGAVAPVPAPRGPVKLAGLTALTRITIQSQSIIYTANLVLNKVGDVTAIADEASGIVIGAGGYVAGEQENLTPGFTPQVSLTLKIPVAVYQATLSRIAKLGHKLSFSQNAVDVTQQVADVNSRVTSAQAAIRQLRALLSRAGSINDLLNVQDQINQQESNLEALLAQQQALAHETSYATVSLVLFGHHPGNVKHHKKARASHNFVTGLKAGWHGLVSVVSWGLTVLGAILPFLVIAALVVAAAWAGRRRLLRRKTPPPAEAA